VIVNMIFVCCETGFLATGAYEDNKHIFQGFEALFVSVYCMEVLIKLGTMGLFQYWKDFNNRSDFVLTAVNLIGSVWLATDPENIAIHRYVLILRLIRIIDLMDNFEDFELIFATFTRLIPQFAVVIGVLITLFYFYAEIGVFLFGGLVKHESAGLPPDLIGSDYAKSDYFDYNFNDFGMAFVVLFELLIGNNWNTTQDGFIRLTNEGARVFFISFYFLAVLITLNLVVALILDAFVAEFTKKIVPESEETTDEEEMERRKTRVRAPSASPSSPASKNIKKAPKKEDPKKDEHKQQT